MTLVCRRSTLVPLLLALAWSSGSCEAEPGVPAVPGILWSLALENSDTVAASGLAVESASSALAASGRLPEPSLRIGWAAEPLETRNGPVDFTATLSQRIPWPGVLSSSREQARFGEEVSELEDLMVRLSLRTRITGIWAEMYIARMAMELDMDELERVEHLAEVADIRYRSGQEGLRSLLLLENRTVLLRSRLDGYALTLEALEAEMASVTGLDIPSLDWPDSLPGPDFFSKGIAGSSDPEDTPAAMLGLARSEFGRAAADRADADRYPDLEVGVTWSVVGEPAVDAGAVDPDRDALMLYAGMSLPLGYSGTAERAASSRLSARAMRYMYMQTVSDREAERLQLQNRIESLVLLCESYRETVLPNLEAVYDLAMTDWISGRTSIDEVLDSLGDLEEARLEERKTWSGMAVAYAGLLELEGRETEEGEFL